MGERWHMKVVGKFEDSLVWWTEGYRGNYGCKGRLGYPWLWKHVEEVFQSYRIKNWGLTMKKWVSTLPSQGVESLYLFRFCFASGTTTYSISPISLACLPPTQPLAISSHSHADISLTLISCYFFMGASGLTMQRDFSHIIERTFWLCAEMSATMRSCTVSIQSPVMMVFWSPPPRFLPGNFLLPSGSNFSRYYAVSKLPSLQPDWWVPHKAYWFWGPACECCWCTALQTPRRWLLCHFHIWNPVPDGKMLSEHTYILGLSL